jgi:hypothetical protein
LYTKKGFQRITTMDGNGSLFKVIFFVKQKSERFNGFNSAGKLDLNFGRRAYHVKQTNKQTNKNRDGDNVRNNKDRKLFLKYYYPNHYFWICLGVVHKWRHGLRARGGQGFCDNSTKAIVLKSVTIWGGGGSKNVKNCVTSFMDDPLL